MPRFKLALLTAFIIRVLMPFPPDPRSNDPGREPELPREPSYEVQSSLPAFFDQLYHEDHGVVALTTAVVSKGALKSEQHSGACKKSSKVDLRLPYPRSSSDLSSGTTPSQ